MRKKSRKSNLTDEQRQKKINETIITREHFTTERIYQNFLKASKRHGYENVNDFIKKEYFETAKTQKDMVKIIGCANHTLNYVLEKAGLTNLKKYKDGKRKYTKSEKIYVKRGRWEKVTPNTKPQTKKWYICTNCGKETRNRLLCDNCYANAGKDIEHDEHKVYD